MPMIAVSQLKDGERLSDNVLTKLGSTLFYKGIVVSEREIEILKAFLIQAVPIESREGQEAEENWEESKAKEEAIVIHPFYEEYNKMLQLLKRVFNLASGGQSLPILDIRTNLEALLQHIDFYKVLTFSPKHALIADYFYHKSIMVSLSSYSLARWYGLPQKDLMQIALAGLLHDIGNVKVDADILNKNKKLTEREMEEVKKHTITGYSILKNVPALNEGAKLCALQHHEREDGSGYPLSVKGDKIHSYAKIVAIADIYHAMTNDRIYKLAMSPYLVLEQLFTESFGKVDPALVQVFISKSTQFDQGTLVKLSDNRVGEIVFSDRANPTRPWVNVNGTIVNLSMERALFIKDVISSK
ncbi:HD-GYP domain-containing protein [Paenibacillus eucommiae]|uniref:HD-GYP domain-containing protein (C-di-GMP phosphodiesterase class II) n=1 Tax=Paenibacillus eucommiae TaxID=1355755 RepID=A0ABS4J740_9BACL|nr:HD-GYP domain-containing protein [Paenibacillus eucommiae]MBP1994589.1 HD-GYP domain-containing protein (c-di-GMP phosphodiesterase class II) [Paenibacillus eucommiae]